MNYQKHASKALTSSYLSLLHLKISLPCPYLSQLQGTLYIYMYMVDHCMGTEDAILNKTTHKCICTCSSIPPSKQKMASSPEIKLNSGTSPWGYGWIQLLTFCNSR